MPDGKTDTELGKLHITIATSIIVTIFLASMMLYFKLDRIILLLEVKGR